MSRKIMQVTQALTTPRLVVDSKEEKKDDDPVDISLPLPRDLLSTLMLKPSVSGGDKCWKIPIGGAANLSTNGSGLISSALTMAGVSATSYFTSLATLFDEFYIESCTIQYQPSTRYQTLPSSASTDFNGTPLGIASLFLDTSSYTNINQMPANPTFKFKHTSSPFTYVWKNNVRRSEAMSSEPTSTQAALGWVRTNATPSQYYGGTVQFIGSASSAMRVSTVVGILAYRWDVWFRAKA